MTGVDPSEPSSGADHDRVGTILRDLLIQLDRAGTAEAMYTAVDTALAGVTAFDRLAVGMVDTATHRLRTVYRRGDTLGLPDHYETLPADPRSFIYSPVVQGVSVLHTLHPDRDVYRGDAIRRRAGMVQAVASPIVAGGAVVGLITLNSVDPDRYSATTVTVVEAVARMLGMALAAQPRPDTDRPASQVIADTLAQIALASSATEVCDSLYRGIEAATGASVVRCQRLADGSYVFVDGHLAGDASPGELDIEDTGRAIAGKIGALIDADIGSASIPQRAIVTDRPLGDQASVRVHGTAVLPEDVEAGAAVIAPLHAARELLGALVAIWPDPPPSELLPDYAAVVFSFSDLAGPALHRLILLDRLEKRLAETEVIRRLTDSIARTPRLRDALDIITRTSKYITGVDFVAVAEADLDHVTWHSVAGARTTSFLHQRLPGPEQVLRQLLSRHQDVLIEDVLRHPEFSPELMPVHTAEGLRSTAIIPVHVNARLRAAVLFGHRRPYVFTPEEVTTFHAIAAAAATALASADARIRDDTG